MLTQTQFKAKPQFALLLMGPPLTGKTNVVFQFPGLYVNDADDKLSSAVNRNPGKEFFYDCPMRNDDGSVVPEELRWEKGVAQIKAAVADPRVKTIALDSGTAIGHNLINHILRFPSTAKAPLMIGGMKVMDMSMWGPYRDLWTKLIMGLRATGKLVIVVMHDVADKDEVTGAINYRPSFAGQLKDYGAGLFTDVWHTETRAKIQDDRSKPGFGLPTTEYYIRTAPRSNMPLGTSLGLPAEFVFTWEQLRSKLEVAPPAPATNTQAAPV